MTATELPEFDPEVGEPTIRTDMTVELIQHMGDDASILAAMMVSTKAGESRKLLDEDPAQAAGKINFLMANRHGTPFEHAAVTFYMEAPIFVYREFHRHRVGFSYNEESARYKKLKPVFYVPSGERDLVQVGKPGAYTFVPGTSDQLQMVVGTLAEQYISAYKAYSKMMDAGVAKEIARACLPVAIYSSQYVTCNPRSLMAFLSLRTRYEGSHFPSFPQREIAMVAEKMEAFFAELFPITHEAFRRNGSVSP